VTKSSALVAFSFSVVLTAFFCLFLDLKRVLYELLWHVVRGDLKAEDAIVVLADVKVSA